MEEKKQTRVIGEVVWRKRNSLKQRRSYWEKDRLEDPLRLPRTRMGDAPKVWTKVKIMRGKAELIFLGILARPKRRQIRAAAIKKPRIQRQRFHVK